MKSISWKISPGKKGANLSSPACSWSLPLIRTRFISLRITFYLLLSSTAQSIKPKINGSQRIGFDFPKTGGPRGAFRLRRCVYIPLGNLPSILGSTPQKNENISMSQSSFRLTSGNSSPSAVAKSKEQVANLGAEKRSKTKAPKSNSSVLLLFINLRVFTPKLLG